MSDVVINTSSTGDDLAAYNPSKYSAVDDDSNLQAQTTIGECHLVQSTGGGDDVHDTGQQPGKTLL